MGALMVLTGIRTYLYGYRSLHPDHFFGWVFVVIGLMCFGVYYWRMIKDPDA